MKSKRTVKIFAFFAILCFAILFGNNIALAGTLSSDINGINDSKYPGIKSAIQTLQRKHSNYNFQVYYTGIDWTEAVTMEYQGHGKSPKNLFSVSETYKGKWYCPICGSKVYDSGRWYCASIEAIEYMMDPRNSIDENSVFQFKNLESSDVSSDNIRTIINNTYKNYSYINNDTAINAIVTASQKYNLNGYSILAKIINEQGTGTSCLVTGAGYEGYGKGYYNFFNVNASGNGKKSIYTNALNYAMSHGWNSVLASILGGSEYYKSQYIGKGQNTLYYQRFNVSYERALFSHQYQQDIMGAETSGRLLKSYYTNTSTLGSVPQTFIIPLYENMPATKCPRPSTAENSTLEYTEEKVITNKLAVRAAPNSSRIISYLNYNESVKVLKRASNVSADGNYWDTILTNTDGTYGYVLRSGITQKITLPRYVFDYKYYADNNSDLKAAYGYDEQKLINHFVTYGIKEGRASSYTFDLKYYLENNIDLKNAFGNNYQAVYDYFMKYGCNEYRKNSKYFDGFFYKYYYQELNNFTAIQLMEHYITYGIASGTIGTLDTDVEQILFDSEVYAECNWDIKAACGTDFFVLRQHWLQYGINDGREASLIFNARRYLEFNDDLRIAFGTTNYRAAFEYFIKYGINEPRDASYIFSITQFLQYNPDIKAAFGTNYKAAYCFFKYYGIKEGRFANRVFGVTHYLAVNPDIKAAIGTNYKAGMIHFLNYGIHALRTASPYFDLVCYYQVNTDVRNAYGNEYMKYYLHYVKYGFWEGRKAF